MARDATMKLRLSAQEKRQLVEAAGREPVAAFVRRLVLDALDRGELEAQDPAPLADVLRRLDAL